MDSTFLRACEAWADRFEVPALQLALLDADGSAENIALGCDPGDRFRIASITKPVTASAAVQLLDLDATTSVWPDDVRVRHLLSHTSGFDSELADLARLGDGDDALGAAVAEMADIRRLLGSGEVFSYANSGYWLVGWLIAQAAGTTYEEAITEHVLQPAGLSSTDFGEPSLAGTGADAARTSYPRARRPSGGLVSRAADVAAFGRWQLANAWSAVLRQPQTTLAGGEHYGFGFAGEHVGEAEVWGHAGSYGGFQSALLIVPERGAVFAGLTNSGRGKLALREIEDLWLERVLGVRRALRPTVELASGDLDAFTGVYENAGSTASVEVGGSSLLVSFSGGDETVEVTARAVGPAMFEIVGGDYDRDSFDFPRPGLARFGSVLLKRRAAEPGSGR
jgi:CubicO group peptidase (beta-lactamase class C family)